MSSDMIEILGSMNQTLSSLRPSNKSNNTVSVNNDTTISSSGSVNKKTDLQLSFDCINNLHADNWSSNQRMQVKCHLSQHPFKGNIFHELTRDEQDAMIKEILNEN